MSDIVQTNISTIDANPFRNLDSYPFVEAKLKALEQSIADVGLWEGVIARKQGNRYQIAFGHHRIEAAKRVGLKKIPIIARDLTDEQLIKFLGRENMEDYNTNFQALLETWEAGVNFVRAATRTPADIEIARLLGWVRANTTVRGKPGDTRITNAAEACANAYKLMQGGYLAREDVKEMSVGAARKIVQSAVSRMEQLERIAKVQTHIAPEQTEEAKQRVAKGAKITARKVREGTVADKDIRGTVDVETYKIRTKDEKPNPLFATFAANAAKRLAKMIDGDKTAEHLENIRASLDMLLTDEDKAALRSIDFELEELGLRAEKWRKQLTPTAKKVVSITKAGD